MIYYYYYSTIFKISVDGIVFGSSIVHPLVHEVFHRF
jgi:hypothetical protein